VHLVDGGGETGAVEPEPGTAAPQVGDVHEHGGVPGQIGSGGMRYVRGLFVDRHRSGIQPLRAAIGGGHQNRLVGADQDGKPGVGTDLEVVIGESGIAVQPGGDAAIGEREGSVFLQFAVDRVGRQLGLGNPAGIAQGVVRCGLAGDQACREGCCHCTPSGTRYQLLGVIPGSGL